MFLYFAEFVDERSNFKVDEGRRHSAGAEQPWCNDIPLYSFTSSKNQKPGIILTTGKVSFILCTVPPIISAFFVDCFVL